MCVLILEQEVWVSYNPGFAGNRQSSPFNLRRSVETVVPLVAVIAFVRRLHDRSAPRTKIARRENSTTPRVCILQDLRAFFEVGSAWERNKE